MSVTTPPPADLAPIAYAVGGQVLGAEELADLGRAIHEAMARRWGATGAAAAEEHERARAEIVEALEWPATSTNTATAIYHAAALEIAELRAELEAARGAVAAMTTGARSVHLEIERDRLRAALERAIRDFGELRRSLELSIPRLDDLTIALIDGRGE